MKTDENLKRPMSKTSMKGIKKVLDRPQYKIFGTERIKLKKELSELKSFIKGFWHEHQMDKDMTSFYSGTDTFPMSDDAAKEMYDKNIEKIKLIENKLKTKYNE